MAKKPANADEATITRRDVSALLLDPENPRIAVSANATQSELLRTLYETEALEELALSLARNGYFLEEPLVVVPRDGKHLMVVEGNRRLATIKLLLDPQLQKTVGATSWPTLSDVRKAELEAVPTVLYPSRDEVVPYLGFRHITGIKTWDPIAKARYIATLVKSGRTLADIEQSVGDGARTVRRLYQSFLVVRQVETMLGMDVKPIERSFSLLEVALAQSSVKVFLGVAKRMSIEDADTVVPEERLSELRELVSWVFGDPSQRQERIITDSRQIPSRLGPVIGDAEALDYLRKTRDLETAYEFSGGERNVLFRQLANTKRSAQGALGLIPAYKNDAEVRAAVNGLKPVVEALLSSVVE